MRTRRRLIRGRGLVEHLHCKAMRAENRLVVIDRPLRAPTYFRSSIICCSCRYIKQDSND
jgi:hypothetical protein